MNEPADPTIEQLNLLLAECEQFVSICQALSAKVQDAADAFVSSSVPFDSSLLEALVQIRGRFDAILERLPGELAGPATAAEIRESVQSHISRVGMGRTLAEAATLQYTRGSFAPLETLLSEIDGFRSNPSAIDHDWLVAIEALLHLVREHESMPEGESSDLMDLVSQRISRLLAVAAGRGRLRFGAVSDSSPEPSPLPGRTDEASAQGVLSEGDSNPSSTIAAASTAKAVPPGSEKRSAIVEGDAPSSEISAFSRSPAQDSVGEPSSGSTRVADSLNQTDVESTTSHSEENRPLPAVAQSAGSDHRQTIAAFLETGEYALAFQLATALESKTGKPVLGYPSWVLRAVTLAPFALKSEGRIAESLREAFGNFADDAFEGVEGSDAQNLRCLIAAACLRPSVIAPDCGAPDVLARIYPDGELTPVYDLCTVVSEFGKSHVGAELSVLGETASAAALPESSSAPKRNT